MVDGVVEILLRLSGISAFYMGKSHISGPRFELHFIIIMFFFLLLGGSPKQRIRNVTCNNNDNNKPSPTRHIQTPQQRVEYQHYCTSRAESKPSPTKYSSHPFIDAVITSNRQPGETTVIFILHIYTFFVSNSVA